MLLEGAYNLGSRCRIEERGSQAWCHCASGPAAKPPSRMLRIRGKPGNNPQGKVNFPLGFSRLSWARSPQTFVNPESTGDVCLLFPACFFAYWDARDEIPCRGDEPLMTACGGNFIGGEVRRNEQCPLCGLATIEPAELGPRRPQRNPLVT